MSQRRVRARGTASEARARKEKPPLEKAVEIQVRVALAAAGVMVMKHEVLTCHECGARPNRRQGLGIGVSDLVCVVPPHGRFLGIEMKRPGYTPSDVREAQTRWLGVVRRFGGVTGVASSVDEAMALVAGGATIAATTNVAVEVTAATSGDHPGAASSQPRERPAGWSR
jgi:hypothetical protein